MTGCWREAGRCYIWCFEATEWEKKPHWRKYEIGKWTKRWGRRALLVHFFIAWYVSRIRCSPTSNISFNHYNGYKALVPTDAMEDQIVKCKWPQLSYASSSRWSIQLWIILTIRSPVLAHMDCVCVTKIAKTSQVWISWHKKNQIIVNTTYIWTNAYWSILVCWIALCMTLHDWICSCVFNCWLSPKN